jgi:hypothetical protein
MLILGARWSHIGLAKFPVKRIYLATLGAVIKSLFGGRLLLKARIRWAAKRISLGLFELSLVLAHLFFASLRRCWSVSRKTSLSLSAFLKAWCWEGNTVIGDRHEWIQDKTSRLRPDAQVTVGFIDWLDAFLRHSSIE